MRTKIVLGTLALAAMFISCNEDKREKAKATANEVIDETGEALDTAAAKIDTLAGKVKHEVGDAMTKDITVTGKVTEIINGKDGYMARIQTSRGNIYSATISIPNLDDPKQYRTVKVGDQITVKGEATQLEDDMLIRVDELK